MDAASQIPHRADSVSIGQLNFCEIEVYVGSKLIIIILLPGWVNVKVDRLTDWAAALVPVTLAPSGYLPTEDDGRLCFRRRQYVGR